MKQRKREVINKKLCILVSLSPFSSTDRSLHVSERAAPIKKERDREKVKNTFLIMHHLYITKNPSFMTDIAFFSIQSNFIFEKIRIREGEVNEDYTSIKKKNMEMFSPFRRGKHRSIGPKREGEN